jgi:thioredoxin reductase (NADPH)
MVARTVQNPKIKILYSHVVEDVLDVKEDKVTGILVKDLKSGKKTTVPTSAMFVAIGHTPLSDLFVGQVELHPNGYIKTTPGTAKTSVPGVFASGDVQDWVYRQAVTAAGTGCMAALEAERWLAQEAH